MRISGLKELIQNRAQKYLETLEGWHTDYYWLYSKVLQHSFPDLQQQ